MKKIYGAFIACLALALPALAADETEGYHTARPAAAAGCLENDTAIGQNSKRSTQHQVLAKSQILSTGMS